MVISASCDHYLLASLHLCFDLTSERRSKCFDKILRPIGTLKLENGNVKRPSKLS